MEKRIMARNIAWFCVLLAVLGSLIWFNNLSIALQWNPKAGHGFEYHGPISYFDRFAVDFSTVSTLVPFFGMCLIARGFFSIAKAKEKTNCSKVFPFFVNYERIMVALGLMGTVWGLIMIGYYPSEQVQMSQLINCLRTALYSTLIALIWVFLIVIPLRYSMQRAYRSISGYQVLKPNETIISLLGDLSSAASGLTETINETSSTFSQLKNEVSGAKKEFQEVDKLIAEIKGKAEGVFDKAQESFNQISSGSRAWQRAAEKQQKAAEAQEAFFQQLTNELDKVIKERDELKGKLDQTKQELVEVKSKFRRLRDFVRGIVGK